MYRGYVQNYRKLKEWSYYKIPAYSHLWQHIIREANHKDTKWRNILVPRGSLYTGLKQLSQETGITLSSCNRILKCLESEKQIEQKITTKYRIISICKYDDYQGMTPCTEKQKKNKRKTNEKQMETSNNVNNINNVNKVYTHEHRAFWNTNKNFNSILEYWNQQNIINHTYSYSESPSKEIMMAYRGYINRCEDFSHDEIIESIDNYKKVLDLKGFFKHKWRLSEFLKRDNALKFYGENFCLSNYQDEKKIESDKKGWT